MDVESSESFSPVNYENGRVEIWALRDFHWTLPVRVTWFEQSDVAAVDVDIEMPLLDRQKQAIAQVLTEMGEFRNGHWWILRKILNIRASKSDKAPEDIVRWMPGSVRIKVDGDNNTEFEKHLINCGMYGSVQEAHYHWFNMRKAAADWMINKKRPLNFYCCTLVPVPYRVNWKEALLKHRKRGRQAEAFHTGYLLAYDESRGRLYWSLDVDYHTSWDRMVGKSENETIESHTNETYAAYIQGILRHFEKVGMELYEKFVAAVQRPQAFFYTSGNRKCKIYMRKPKPGEVLALTREARTYPVVFDPGEQGNRVAGEVSAESPVV